MGPTMTRIAVIGAGIAGLVSAKVLRQDGFDVTVFDKEPTIGGVWAPSRAYPGLRTNNPRETYGFSDFPWPEHSDEFPTAGQVHDYLESYAERFGLRPCLRLATEAVSVSPWSRGHPRSGFRVTTRPTAEDLGTDIHHFDRVVVCNGVFSEPRVPLFPRHAEFTGAVRHSSEIACLEASTGKRVIVVGGGKSALDCATAASRFAASTDLIFRAAHWMLPRYFGTVRVDRVLQTRLSELLLPAHHSAGRFELLLRAVGAPLLSAMWRARSRRVARLNGIPATMVPDRPLPEGIESVGIGGEFYDALREGRVTARRASIASFTGARSIRLDTGEEIAADLVVCATGWRRNVSFLDPELSREVHKDGSFRLYRHILPPGNPHLGFVGYASSTACPLLSEISAHWLSQCFRGELALPDESEMEREIARVIRWARRTFPACAEGHFIGAYVAHYADALMRDMGLPRRRTGSVLSEYSAPIWSERYRQLAEERRRARP